MRSRFALVIVVIALLFDTMLVLAAPAASSPATSTPAAKASSYALTVSPVKVELLGIPGQRVTADVEIMNAGSASATLKSDATDFVAEGEGGEPRFLPTGTSEWSMSNWVSTDPPSLTLKPGEKRKVKVTIAVPGNAEPGGHYAAVLFSSVPLGGGQTAVVAKVGTLILLTVRGDIQLKGTASIASPWLVEKGPVAMPVRFTNAGNVHLKPAGEIQVTQLWGAPVTTLKVDSQNVLPGSERLLPASWNAPGLGVYVAHADLKYGTTGQSLLTPNSLVIVFPWMLALGALAVFALGIGTALLLGRRKRAPADAA
jgi:hypothetical protein